MLERSLGVLPWHLMNFPLVDACLFLSRLARAISIQPSKACPSCRPARLGAHKKYQAGSAPYVWSRGPMFLIKDLKTNASKGPRFVFPHCRTRTDLASNRTVPLKFDLEKKYNEKNQKQAWKAAYLACGAFRRSCLCITYRPSCMIQSTRSINHGMTVVPDVLTVWNLWLCRNRSVFSTPP